MTLVLLFGAYALVDGIFNVIAFIRVASHQWALLIEGVIGVIGAEWKRLARGDKALATACSGASVPGEGQRSPLAPAPHDRDIPSHQQSAVADHAPFRFDFASARMACSAGNRGANVNSGFTSKCDSVIGNKRLLTSRALNDDVYDFLGELLVLPNAEPETHEYRVTHHPKHRDKAVTTQFLAPYCPIDDEPGRDLAVPPA